MNPLIKYVSLIPTLSPRPLDPNSSVFVFFASFHDNYTTLLSNTMISSSLHVNSYIAWTNHQRQMLCTLIPLNFLLLIKGCLNFNYIILISFYGLKYDMDFNFPVRMLWFWTNQYFLGQLICMIGTGICGLMLIICLMRQRE